MAAAAIPGSPLAGSLRTSLACLVSAAVLLAVAQVAIVLDDGGEPIAVLAVLPALVYVAAGALAWARRPSNRLGAVIVGGGLLWFLAGFGETGVPALVTVGTVLATAPVAVVVHLLHAFPSGRLASAPSRVVVLAGYVVNTVLEAPRYLFAAGSPLSVADRPDLLVAGTAVQGTAGIAVVLATVAVLVDRLRRAGREHRRIVVPLYLYGIGATVFFPFASIVLGPLLGLSATAVAVLQLVVLSGVPVAFVVGVLRGGFARTGEVDELAAWLGTAGSARTAVTDALATALGDPSLRLAFWIPDRQEYVAASGGPVELPPAGSGRDTVGVSLGERHVGAVVYDSALIGERHLVERAARVVALVVDHERLTAELRATSDALRRSRVRIVESADRERRQLAHDLHDGLQTQLILLAVQAEQITLLPQAGAEVCTAARALRARIDTAAADLRGLVHSVLPAALIERGLPAAAEDLVDRIPIPATLDLRGGSARLPAAVESTAYFVICEALTNAVKHASARSLAVQLDLGPDAVRIEVTDDGVGGAAHGAGMGLRGLVDRVETLGGEVWVSSAAGAGTMLRARIPCGS